MQNEKNNTQPSGKPRLNEKAKDENVSAAYKEAEKDIEQDPDLSIHHPNDDLDEGETARLGDGKNDLI